MAAKENIKILEFFRSLQSGRGLPPPACQLSENTRVTLQRKCLNRDFNMIFLIAVTVKPVPSAAEIS
jgi:hypothetical protein